MKFWKSFSDKHPKVAKWVREGGLFVIVSNLVTVFKYLLLTFLPAAFSGLGDKSFGWPGIPVTLLGETFQWNILGYDQAHGGLAYFAAYMVAMIIGECVDTMNCDSSSTSRPMRCIRVMTRMGESAASGSSRM